MKKIAVYVGSRANYSSARSIMKAIQEHPDLELKLLLAGAAVLPRFGDLRQILLDDGFIPDIITNSIVEGETPSAMSKSVGLGMIDYSMSLEKMGPDCVVAVGDRFDVLPWVLSAAMMNIPIAHTMGGERTGTIDESIRHAITKFAHIHFPANQDSADRIIAMGEDPAAVHVVGCPRNDYVQECLYKIRGGEVMSAKDIFYKYKGVGGNFDINRNKPFLLVLYHPVTTEFGSNGKHMKELLAALEELKMNTIMVWPNADAGSDEISKEIRRFREQSQPNWLRVFVNLPINVFVQLMYQCSCMIGNSSSAIREGELIGVPAVNIGTRQNMRLKGGNIVDSSTDRISILEAVRSQIAHGPYETEYLYGTSGAGDKMADIIASTNLATTQKINFY